MKVLLINPPATLEKTLGVGSAFVQHYEPLGLLYIAAVAQEDGHEVEVVDCDAEKIDLEDLKKIIQSSKANVIGFSVLTCHGEVAYELGHWCKVNYPETILVFGNVHAEVYAEQYLKNMCCDVVVHGEGEYVFLDIIKAVELKKKLSDIDCISYCEEGKYIRNKRNEIVTDLDLLPLPARDLVKQSLYGLSPISNQLFINSDGKTCKTMVSSRGCVNSCEFCVVHKHQAPRFASAQKVVDEMELLENKYGAAYVYIQDPLFFANKKRIREITLLYKQKRLSIKWGCDAHVKFIDRELLREIESAGCYDLSFGLESGVQRLLDNVSKNITLEEATKAIALVKSETKIKVGGLFILGLPGETKEDSLKTIAFAKKLPLDMAQFSILTPYPGSPLFDKLREANELDTGIRDDNRLNPTVWRRYSSYSSFSDQLPIWTTSELSPKMLVKLQKKANRQFYLRPRIIWQNIKRINGKNFWQVVKVVSKGFF